MSQQQFFNTSSTPGVPNVEFLQGNDNIPVGPNPATHVIDVIGDTTKGVSVTNTAPYTEKVSVAFATYTTPGVSSYNVTNFTVAAGVVSSNAIDIIAGTGLTGGGSVNLGGSVTLNATAGGPDLHTARFIVSAGGSADGANYTTIASAYAAAVTATAPQTVFIQPGTYTEDITLVAGINLTAFICDSQTPNVTILGATTASYSGSCSISGINLETNSNYAVILSGSNETVLNIVNSFITASNNDAIQITNSNSASLLNLVYTDSDIETTGITMFDASGACGTFAKYCYMDNSGGSTTPSVFSGADFTPLHSSVLFSVTTSSTAGLFSSYTNFLGVVTLNGTANAELNNCSVVDTTTTPVIIGSGVTLILTDCQIDADIGSVNAIAGLGTLNCTPISFIGTTATIQNTITVNMIPFLPLNALVPANNLSDVASQPTALNNIMPPTPAKGTIAVFNGTDWANLPVGTDTYVLTANSGAGDGVDWAAPGGGGSPVNFNAYFSTTQNNVTGDGTVINPVIFDSVQFNNGAGYSSGVFTAPVAGLYQFSGIIWLDNLNVAHTNIVSEIITTAASYVIISTNPSPNITGGGQYLTTFSFLTQMSMGDTAQMYLGVGGSTKTVQIVGGLGASQFSVVKVG